MLPRNKAKLKRELNRINRVIDHAEVYKIAEGFVEARKAVYGLVDFIDELIAVEIAEQLADLFITENFSRQESVPTSERSGTPPG